MGAVIGLSVLRPHCVAFRENFPDRHEMSWGRILTVKPRRVFPSKAICLKITKGKVCKRRLNGLLAFQRQLKARFSWTDHFPGPVSPPTAVSRHEGRADLPAPRAGGSLVLSWGTFCAAESCAASAGPATTRARLSGGTGGNVWGRKPQNKRTYPVSSVWPRSRDTCSVTSSRATFYYFIYIIYIYIMYVYEF